MPIYKIMIMNVFLKLNGFMPSLIGKYFPVAGNRGFPAQFIGLRGRFLTCRTMGSVIQYLLKTNFHPYDPLHEE
jgi:hypothetical protein